ncbi:structural maintenance of chromosomes protein 6B-like [Carica papaya]|uniref:structural maintenance of chromosomes protein 6B-like n=1 Tax=Carica papaya TaxID=3649 RepID=UPI000B8CA28A|nr:structural maintenance of chromosomes protein 6B-like [Carica papaya]
MSQDKSREFLHSGNDRDKFKFFFKATLLQQVNDLLQRISGQLKDANALIEEREATIRPIEQELSKLQGKIKNMEHIEEISQQVQQLKKKLAWSWVYDVDRQLREQTEKIGKLKNRIPTCQAKINWETSKVQSLKDRLKEKKAQVEVMVEKSSIVKRSMDELKHSISLATKEKQELEEENRRRMNDIQKTMILVRRLEKEASTIHEQHIRSTQVLFYLKKLNLHFLLTICFFLVLN